jgi:hemoglobin
MRRTIAFAVLAWLSLLAIAPADAHEQTAASLYMRLGGYDAIAAVVDDFIGRLATDAKLAKFFDSHSTDSLKRIRQQIVDQLCEVAGGPCYYTGRTMKASHEGLKITQAEWDLAVKHLTASLDRFKVGDKERGELFAAIGSLQASIVAAK